LTYKVLLTGFEPYHIFDENPSGTVALALDGREIEGATVHSKILPSLFDETPKAISKLLEEEKPDISISLGLMPYSVAVQVERFAVNLKDYTADGIPDNKGQKPVDEQIVAGGPLALAATIPVRRICEEINRAGIPAVISNTAGTHNCNLTLYTSLRFVEQNRMKMRVGFMHVPFTPRLVAQISGRPPYTPSLPLDVSTKAVEIAISTAVKDVRNRSRI
jgi:pyroglutamyl-peptidase